jgi:phage baseplate assembly protein W
MPIGFTVPFAQSTSSVGYFYATTTDAEAALADLKSLALTNWGERPMHYELGFNLREFLFEQITAETAQRVDDRVRSQMARWLPFLGLKSLDIKFPNDQAIQLVIKFFMISKPNSVETLGVEVTR